MQKVTKRIISVVTLGLLVTIALVAASSTFILVGALNDNREFAEVINRAGKQRMLVQKLGRAPPGKIDSEQAAEIFEARRAFRDGHQWLIEGFEQQRLSPDPEAMADIRAVLYAPPHELMKRYAAFEAAIEDRLDVNTTYPRSDLLVQTPSMTGAYDALVRSYESLFERRNQGLIQSAYVSLSVVLAVLMAIGTFVLRPLGRLILDAQAELRAEAETDPLTGMLNRRALEQRSYSTLLLCRRTQSPLSVVMLDIDHFKMINDTYGHAVGDSVLQHLAEILEKNLRKTDVAARTGGEEFTLVLPDTEAQAAAETVAEGIRRYLLSHPFADGDVRIPYTVSLGVSSVYPFEESLANAMLRADSALYLAKSEGRNRVAIQYANQPIAEVEPAMDRRQSRESGSELQ